MSLMNLQTPLEPITRRLPSNVEAEQALLGALFENNDLYDQVAGIVQVEHFFEPLHARLFDAIGKRVMRGQSTNPITLKTMFADDPALQEIGGAAYLMRLAQIAPSFYNVMGFAEQVYDLALRRELIRLGEEMIEDASGVNVDETASDKIVEAEKRLFSLAEKGRFEGGFQDFATSITQAVEITEAAYKRDGGLSGLSSGLRDMDKRLGGFHPSDLIILAGRPSMGKTSLATNIAFNIARRYRQGILPDGTEGTVDGGVVGFFSLEMSAEQLCARVLAEQSGVTSSKLRQGDLDSSEFAQFVEAAQELEHIPLYIDDTGALPISTMTARARRLKRQKGLDVIIVDYLQLLRGSSNSDNRVQELTEITQGLKALAKELDIPVIALSQLSRQVENRDDKRPQLSDLRESGSIEQDADVVMFVFREEYYESRREPREGTPEHTEWQASMAELEGLAEVIIGKQRHGPIGTIRLQFEGRLTRFSDLAEDRGYDGGF